DVTQARTAAQQAQGPQAQAAAENVLTQALGRLFAVAENYPQLRATENFQQLQAQLSETESNIAVARQVYNDTVLTYDNALEAAPLVVAPPASARSYDLEKADVSVRVAANGALLVSERIQVFFFGSFTFGYRDIPLRPGESIDHITVHAEDILGNVTPYS